MGLTLGQIVFQKVIHNFMTIYVASYDQVFVLYLQVCFMLYVKFPSRWML